MLYPFKVTDLCNAARRGIKINVLLDFFRGTRGLVNSASLLAPLTAFQKVNGIFLYLYLYPFDTL
jgi:hypothetical protein